MSNYEIKIQIAIQKTDSEKTNGVASLEEKGFRIVISQESAQSIDESEKTLLSANYPALRQALSEHLSEMSREDAERHQIGYLKKNFYPVDGEIGRFHFETWSRVNAEGEEIYKGKELFEPPRGEEKYRTQGFREVALIYESCEDSYRETTALINRIRYQLEDGTPERTLRDNTEKEGRQIQAYLEEKAHTLLEQSGFSAQGLPLQTQAREGIVAGKEVEPERLVELIEDCAVEASLKSEILKNPVPYEDPEKAVHIFLDDVGAKKQKEVRLKAPLASPVAVKKREYVQNTVIHIHKKDTRYGTRLK
ncbi:hypothetical protein WDW89_18360 [Deltaproteobacteria bacterium TL4]